LPLLILALSVQPSCRHLSGLIMKYISVKLNVQFLQVILILPCHKQTKRILANIFCNDKWNWLCICTKKEIKKSLLNPINTLLSILYSRQFAKEKIEILTFQIFIKICIIRYLAYLAFHIKPLQWNPMNVLSRVNNKLVF